MQIERSQNSQKNSWEVHVNCILVLHRNTGTIKYGCQVYGNCELQKSLNLYVWHHCIPWRNFLDFCLKCTDHRMHWLNDSSDHPNVGFKSLRSPKTGFSFSWFQFSPGLGLPVLNRLYGILYDPPYSLCLHK